MKPLRLILGLVDMLYKYLNFLIISEYNYLMVQSPEFESSQVESTEHSDM